MRILVEIHLNKGITKGEALRIDSKRGQLFTPVEGHDSMIREAMNQSFGDTRINRDITIQAHVPNERAISTLRQDFNAKVKKI